MIIAVAKIWGYILIGFAVTLLICASNNFLLIVLKGSTWCQWLCPSIFDNQFDFDIPGLNLLFIFQEWLVSSLQEIVQRIIIDRFDIITTLIVTPVLEEIIYRGPMYLMRRYANKVFWWIIGLVLVLVFTLSHETGGIAWLPVLFLGSYSLWLIAKTKRFWPTITLHFLYNFFTLSVIVRQSVWMSD